MTNICNFCLQLSNGCSSVDETLKETIEVVFINVEFVIADWSRICEDCIQRVNSAFELKAASICDEDRILSHEINKPKYERLVEFYLEKNNIKCDTFPKDLKICRFCISVVAENNFHLLEEIEVDTIVGETITTHFCEIDFSITNIPIVCKECLGKLEAYGMFINSWLNIYNLKKNYCHINKKIDTSDLNEVRKFIFKKNIDRQYSDYDIDKTDIKKETFTKLEHESKDDQDDQKEENRDYAVDNIQVKDDIEIDEWKYPFEGLQIKTELVSYDSQLQNDVLSRNNVFEVEESKQETEALDVEPKLQSDDCVLKNEEISINDATYDDDSTQKSNENNFSKPEVEPTEASTTSTFSSRFFTECPPKNSPYQRIEIKDGFRCGLCPFKNQLEIGVKQHFKNYHHPKYNCLNLSEIVHKKHYESHSMVHSIQSKIYECEHCDYKAKYKSNLKTHLKVHSKIHECAHCDYKTRYKPYLKSHSLVHSYESKSYKCEHCDYKTQYKQNLKTHLLVHSNESKIHKCQHCDFKTKYKLNLKSHLRLHSNHTKIYECERCGYKTTLKIYLKRHLIVHSSESETFKCEHCDYKTKYKQHLKSHVMVHSNESKLYKCTHCDYNTKYKHNLKSHFMVHSNESKIHECQFCDFKAKYKRRLKSHLRVHSNES